jgi:hypothetical protein
MAFVFKKLAALAWGYAGYYLGAVVKGEARMAATEVAGDALYQDAGFGSD